MTKKTFKFYADPGHGWLAVKRDALFDLGVADKITMYSYQRGATVYLEEDCDMVTFVHALQARGVVVEFQEKSVYRYSLIRSYDRFKV